MTSRCFRRWRLFCQTGRYLQQGSGCWKSAAEKITLIDLCRHFRDSNKKLNKRYTTNGLHRNAEGYKVWTGVLKKGAYLKK